MPENEIPPVIRGDIYSIYDYSSLGKPTKNYIFENGEPKMFIKSGVFVAIAERLRNESQKIAIFR